MKKSVPLAFCWYPFGASIVQLASSARETAAPGPEIVSAPDEVVSCCAHW
jgi:hypothetical protein